MRQITINATPGGLKTAEYNNLSGVDFSQDAANVDNNRSPYSVNMISDNGKNPVKRDGWETCVTVEQPVHNVWFTKINGKVFQLVHGGSKIYKIISNKTGYSAVLLRSGVADKKGYGFFFRDGEKDGFYILTGEEYLVFDGVVCKEVRDDAYVPVTIIARHPDGGGESYEDINLLNGKMQERYLGDETSLIYQLAYTDIERVDKIEALQADGSLKELIANTDYTVDVQAGRVTFVASHDTPIEGQDNVYITYTKPFEGYHDKIAKATHACTYGVGGNNRVFLTGNEDFPAYDFWSDIYRPSYFPDLNYSIIGAANTAVMGYLKIGKYVAIVKESTGQDTAIFLRSGSLNEDGSAHFFVEPSIVGLGAVSKNAFAVLNDDPLFLSEQGVYAISPNNLSYERVTRNRSWYVDPQLRQEEDLDKAVACIWNGCYVLGVNGNVYILDGRKRTYSGSDNNYRYECYFWDNVPASCFATDFNGALWFGCEDGTVKRFKTAEQDGIRRFSDDGQPIRAIWSTPATDDNAVQRYKTLQKKGCLVVLAPFYRSSCKVYFAVDGKNEKFIRDGNMDIASIFEEITFDRFTFNVYTGPREVYFNKKQRKYKRLQLIFENNEADEGFGIYKIVKTYKVNGYSKNRR